MKHSEHQTAPYISHTVDEEVETLTHLINVLLVLQRPNVRSGSGMLSAEPQCTVASWDVLGGDAGKENSVYKVRHKAEPCLGQGQDTQPFHKHLHVNAASPNISSQMDTEPV